MTDEEFFQKINFDYSGLENVKMAVSDEDFPAARRELAAYYRDRTGKHFRFGPLKPGEGPGDKQALAKAMRPLIERTGEYEESLWKDDVFDWNASKVRHKERMYFFGSIGAAYAVTGDENIAEAWVNLMRSFAQACPKSEGGGMWASMHVGIRMRSGWPEAFHSFILSPSFTDDDMILFLKSTWEQTNYIRYNHDSTSNWLTFAMAGLYTSGAMYPEFADATSWRKYASDTAVADIDVGWLPDGMSIELSPGYGQFFSNYYVIYDLAKEVGRLEEFNLPDLIAKTEGVYELFLKIMAPDRTTPATNDNGPQDVPYVMKKALERFPERKDFLWAATDGKEGVPPDYGSVVLSYAGFAAMRSGWGRDDNMLYFDFGPVGYRHAHQDKLEVILWAYGRQILFDPGRMDYSDTRHSNYCMDAFSHNTALVDNRPQRRKWYAHPRPDESPYQPLDDFQWEAFEEYDYASGVYDDAYGLPGESDAYPYKEGGNFRESWVYPATHHRRVYFHKPDVFVIADTLVAKDDQSHEYDVRWHLDSTKVDLSEDAFLAMTVDENVPNLQIVPLLKDGLSVKTTSAQDDPEFLGWRITKTSDPATTLQHFKSGPGTVQFVTLLLALKPGEESLFERAEFVDAVSTRVYLSDGRVFIVTAPEDPSCKLEIKHL